MQTGDYDTLTGSHAFAGCSLVRKLLCVSHTDGRASHRRAAVNGPLRMRNSIAKFMFHFHSSFFSSYNKRYYSFVLSSNRETGVGELKRYGARAVKLGWITGASASDATSDLVNLPRQTRLIQPKIPGMLNEERPKKEEKKIKKNP